MSETTQFSQDLGTFSGFWRTSKTTSMFYSQGGWGGGRGGEGGWQRGGGGGELKWEGLKGGHSPWLNHSSIVSQGSSSNAKKTQSREKREEVWWKRCVCMSRSCATDVNSFQKKQKTSFTGQGRRKRPKQRKKEREQREKGREYFWDWKEARWEDISSAKVFPGKHVQRVVIRGMAF